MISPDFELVTPPSGDVVPLADMKVALKVDTATQDDLIQGYLDSATTRLDGPWGEMCNCLLTQTWKLYVDYCFPWHKDGLKLPLGPVASIVSVTYFDTSGAQQTLDPSLYNAALSSSPKAESILTPKFGTSWPGVQSQKRAIAVTFVAGYGAAADVPPAIKTAIMMLVDDLYHKRGAYSDKPVSANPHLGRLLSPYTRNAL